MFNTHEINIVLGMTDYLGLSFAYVLSVLKYCRAIGKRSVSYAEKLAFSFVESGIDTEDALKERLAELETVAKNESFVRKLFGMKARSLTSVLLRLMSISRSLFSLQLIQQSIHMLSMRIHLQI